MRRSLPLIALLVVLAGCSGLGGQSPGTTVAPTDGATTNGSGTSTGAPPATDGSPTTGAGAGEVGAADLKADTLAALADVEHYRLEANQTSRLGGNIGRTVVATSTGRFDRVDREANVTQRQEAGGVTTTVRTYVVNDTLYQRRPAFAQRYDSNWVATDLADADRSWDAFDTLSRQRDLLNISEVTLDGTTTVDGEEVYVLRAEPDVDAYENLSVSITGLNPNVSSLSATFYVDTETSLLVASTTELDATQTVNGRTVDVEQRADLRFEGYGEPVDVTLPEEARETAVRLGNATTTGTATDEGRR